MLNALAILVATLPLGTYSISYGVPGQPITHTIGGLTYEECIIIEGNLRNYSNTDEIYFTPCVETSPEPPSSLPSS